MSDTLPQDRHAKTRETFYAKLNLKIGPFTRDDSRKLAEEEFKADSKAVKDKVLYEDRRERCAAMVEQLRDYSPAADDLRKALEAMLTDADTRLKDDPMAWAAANKMLHRQHLSKALETAEKLWSKREESARDDPTAGVAYKALDDLRRQIQTARNLLPASRRAEHETEALRIERDLLASDLKAPAVKTATTDVSKRMVLIEQETTAAALRQKTADSARGELEKAIRRLEADDKPGPIATDAERAGLLRGLRSGDTAMAVKDFALAIATFDREAILAAAILDRNGRDRTAWSKVAAQAPKLAEDARKLAGKATSPLVKAAALEQARRVEELAELKPGDGITYADATQRVQGGRARLQGLVQEEKDFLGFIKQREAADDRVLAQAEVVEQRLDLLRDAVADTGTDAPPDVADGKFADRLDAILAAWRQRMAVATDKASLDEARAITDLMQLASDVRLVYQDPALLSGAITEGRLALAQDAYAKARGAAATQVDALAEADVEAAAKLDAQLRAEDAKAAKARTPGGYAAGVTAVGKIGDRAAELARTLRTAVTTAQQHLADALRPMPAQLQQIVDAAQTMGRPAVRKATLEQQATLQAAYDSLRSVLPATQLDLLTEALVSANDLAGDLRIAVAAATRTKLPDGEKAFSLADAAKALGQVKSKLAKSDVQTYQIRSATTLTEAIAALEGHLGALTPSALEKEVARITLEAARVTEAAKAAKGWADEFEKDELDPIEARLGKAPFKGLPAFVASIQAELKTILGNAAFEGGRQDAIDGAKRLRQRLDDLATTPGALDDAEDALVAAQRKAELDRRKFEADCEVLGKRIDGLDTYPDDKAGLDRALKSAKQAAKADLDTAREQLAAVRSRLDLLTLNPRGLGIHARKQLPSVNARWMKAVAAFNGALDGLEGIIGKLDDRDLDAAGKQAVVTAIAGTRTLFNPAIFIKPLRDVIAEDVEESTRAGAREAALRDLRRMIAYLYKDYRMQLLAACPFDDKLRAHISELNLALLDLENNLLVSM